MFAGIVRPPVDWFLRIESSMVNIDDIMPSDSQCSFNVLSNE